MNLHVYIFSFNRGEYLANLLVSLGRSIGSAPVSIIDDSSNDPLTVHVLRAAQANGIRVIRAPKGRKPGSRGSLHDSMNFVLHSLADSKEYALLVQDDMQVCRTLAASDMQYLHEAFRCQDSAAFIYPTFFPWPEQRARRITELSDCQSYRFTHDFRGLADVSIVNVERARQGAYSYGVDERESARLALRAFGPMIVSAYPFLAYLPFPRSFRYGYKPLAHRIWESRNAGFFPLQAMTEEDSARFVERDIAHDLPLASSWLCTQTPTPRKEWQYMGFSQAPRRIRALAKLERDSLGRLLR